MSASDRLLEILRQHADNRGRVDLTPDKLMTLLGRDAHDTHKALYEARDRGLVELRTQRKGTTERILSIRLRLGALNTARLKEAADESHTVPERAWAWLEQQPTQFGGWIQAAPGDIARALGLDPRLDNRVGVAISGWARQGRVALRKESSRIVAIKLGPGAQPKPSIEQEAHRPRAASPDPEPPREAAQPARKPVEMPPHPELDKYRSARAIGTLPIGRDEGNPYIRVEFTRHPLGEEGLALLKVIEQLLGKEN